MLKSVLLDHNPVVSLFSTLTEKISVFGDFSNYIRSLLFNKDDNVLEKLLFLIGVATLTYKTTSAIVKNLLYWKWLPQHIINNKKMTSARLKERYGECYVAITGFT